MTLQVLEVRQDRVRLGVNKPTETEMRIDDVPVKPGTALTHEARNRLNSIAVALHLSRRQREAGLTGEANVTFDKALETLHELASNGTSASSKS